MIEEIKNPIPGISFIKKLNAAENKYIEYASKIEELPKYLNQYDVFFHTDTLLVQELADEAKIPLKKADMYLRVFFEVIKRLLLDGCRVEILGFGYFITYNPFFARTKKIKPIGFKRSQTIRFVLKSRIKEKLRKYNDKYNKIYPLNRDDK